MEEFKAEIKAQQEAQQRRDINLLNMIESRIMEIVQIEDECKKKMPKLFTQRLPRFMRRRAACHDIKRLPLKLRPKTQSKTKSRSVLLRYRRKIRFRKHKRILQRHEHHSYKDPLKCLMHKWFAKRFKLERDGYLKHVPIHNNTKNQRNLYRQTRHGCAYVSMAHLAAIEVNFQTGLTSGILRAQLGLLNKIAFEISGFTFCSRALENSRYETLVHLYRPTTTTSTRDRDYLCSVLVHLDNRSRSTCAEKASQQSSHRSEVSSQEKDQDKPSQLTLWVPREEVQDVYDFLNRLAEQVPERKFTLTKVWPRNRTRVRLIGPNAWKEALRVCKDSNKTDLESLLADHLKAQNDSEQRLGYSNDHNSSSFGLTIGRFVEGKNVDFVYYNTKPKVVDLIFKNKEGKLLWYLLVKNKAHVVGGYRDLDCLLPAEKYKLIPDHCLDLDESVVIR